MFLRRILRLVVDRVGGDVKRAEVVKKSEEVLTEGRTPRFKGANINALPTVSTARLSVICILSLVSLEGIGNILGKNEESGCVTFLLGVER